LKAERRVDRIDGGFIMDIKCINLRVAGLVKQSGFVWSGCPDAVCAAITALPGILEVAYDAKKDLFTVRFDSQQAGVEDIFTAVYLAGRQTGQDYLPQMASWRSTPKKRDSENFRGYY
jgi:copper chaperone CopZ